MNPLVGAALGSIFRWLLNIGAGYLVAKGIWTADESTEYVIAGAVALATLAWSLYQKYVARADFVNAILSPPATPEEVVKQKPNPPMSTLLSTDATTNVSKFGAVLLMVGLTALGSVACGASRAGVPVSVEGQVALRGRQVVNSLEYVLGKDAKTGPLDELVAQGRLKPEDVLKAVKHVDAALGYAQQLGPVLQLVDAAKDAAARAEGIAKARAVVDQIQTALYLAAASPEGEAGKQALSTLLLTVSHTLFSLGELFTTVKPPAPQAVMIDVRSFAYAA